MNIFAVKDMKAGIYLQPNVQRTVADAIRTWEMLANDDRSDSLIARFPNDFRLFHIGTFDPVNGRLSVLEDPSDLGSAADFKKASAQNTLPFQQTAN